MNLTIQDKKIALIQWLSALDDEKVIEEVSRIRETKEANSWDDLSKEEKASIEKGLADADAGKVKSHDEVRKLYEKWL